MLSESKFYMGYSRWLDQENRYETWGDVRGWESSLNSFPTR